MKYKEFKLGDLFTFKLGRQYKKEDIFNAGKFRVVSAKSNDNGTYGYVEELDEKHVYSNKITVASRGNSGKAYYQKGSFILGPNAFVLIEKIPMTDTFKLYMASLISNLNYGTSYSHYPTYESLKKDTIYLPITDDHQIDFSYIDTTIRKYMNRYVDEIKQEAEKNLEIGSSVLGYNKESLLESIKGYKYEPPKSIKEFNIGELFTIKRGSSLTKSNMTEGDVRFISAKAGNNGIMETIGNSEKIVEGNKITVANNGSVGESFYQDQPFWASGDVSILELKDRELTPTIALYLIAVLKKVGKSYSYTNKWGIDKMKNTNIYLPSIKTDEGYIPDYDYMDKVINWGGYVSGTKLSTIATENQIHPRFNKWFRLT